MNKVENNNEFDEKIKKLKNLYAKNPDEAMSILDDAIESVNMYDINQNELTPSDGNVIKEIGSIKLAYIIIITILVLSGLLNLGQSTMMHIFGIIFFLAGFFIGKSVPVFGLIFLFSHGCSGLGIMIGGLFSNEFYKGILSDMTKGIETYFAIGIAAIVVAIFIMIFYNLSATLRKNDKLPVLSLGLFTFAVVMANLLPHIHTFVTAILG